MKIKDVIDILTEVNTWVTRLETGIPIKDTPLAHSELVWDGDVLYLEYHGVRYALVPEAEYRRLADGAG